MATTLAGKVKRAGQLLLHDPAKAIPYLSKRVLPSSIPKDPHVVRMGRWNHGELPRVPLSEAVPDVTSMRIDLHRCFEWSKGTSLDPYELIVLVSLAKARNVRRILEIGTFNGNTALNLAANTPDDTRVVTVDLGTDWGGTFELDLPDRYRNITDQLKVGYQFHGSEYETKIHQVFGDSARLNWGSLGGPFDLIFIDGNHHESYVRSDSENALRHLHKGGLIVWHDYGMIADVSRVVDDISKRLGVACLQGTRLAVTLS